MREQIKKLMLGNGLAQLLQFWSILILSRIYQPSDFGVLAQVQSIAMIASIGLTLQLHLTIPLSKTQDEALEAVKRIQTLSLGIFFVALMPAIWSGETALYALFLSLFLGLTNTYTGFLVYTGNFGKMSIFYVARALLIIVTQICFAYLHLENGLVIASLAGEALFSCYLGSRRLYSTKNNIPKFNDLKKLILDNKPFSLYGTIQEMVSIFAFYAPLLLFSAKYGEDVGGQYAMANRLVWAPVVLISSSFAQVLYHKLGKEKPTTSADIRSLIPSKKISALAIITVLCTFPMTELFRMILGQQWSLASKLLPLQLLWGLFFLASTPFRVAGRVLLLQSHLIIIDFWMIALTCLIFYLFSLEPLGLMLALLAVVFLQHSSIVALILSKANSIK